MTFGWQSNPALVAANLALQRGGKVDWETIGRLAERAAQTIKYDKGMAASRQTSMTVAENAIPAPHEQITLGRFRLYRHNYDGDWVQITDSHFPDQIAVPYQRLEGVIAAFLALTELNIRPGDFRDNQEGEVMATYKVVQTIKKQDADVTVTRLVEAKSQHKAFDHVANESIKVELCSIADAMALAKEGVTLETAE